MEEKKPKKLERAYEWVMYCKDEEYILTEKQFVFYKNQVENGDTRQIFFSGFHINPAFVSSSERRPAQYLKQKYPCKTCGTVGQLNDFSVCPDCKGTGLNLPKM